MEMMTVTPIGSGVYSVGVSPKESHTVDLRAHSWNGSCTCRTFTECCAFLLRHQRTPKRWRCEHIMGARQWAMEKEFPALVEQNEKIIEMPINENHIADSL